MDALPQITLRVCFIRLALKNICKTQRTNISRTEKNKGMGLKNNINVQGTSTRSYVNKNLNEVSPP